jgi:hypothetical protein
MTKGFVLDDDRLKQGKYDFKEDEIREYLSDVIASNGYSMTVDSVIADITEKLCLMFKDGDEYHFIHKTFLRLRGCSYEEIFGTLILAWFFRFNTW